MKKSLVALPALLVLFAALGCGGNFRNDATQKPANGALAGVVRAEPANGSVTAPAGTALSLKLSAALDPSSFGPDSFIVKDAEGRLVKGTAFLEGPKAVFKPSELLGAGQTYTFGLADSVRDSQGQAFAPFSSTFQTRSATIQAPIVITAQYTMLDNTQPGGPVYAYDDIHLTGTEIAGLTNQDDNVQTVPLPFPVTFYGIAHSSMDVSTNGHLNFDDNEDYSNSSFPYDDGVARIAPFWDDLDLRIPGARVYYQVKGKIPNRRVIVQWYNVGHYSGLDSSPNLDYQVIMYENSTSILFQYRAVGSWGLLYDRGGSATIGLNLGDGISSTQYSYNTQSLVNGRAILFSNYDMIFTDNHGASRIKISSTSGNYLWEVLSGGVVTKSFTGTGVITILPGSIKLKDGTKLNLTSNRSFGFTTASYYAPGIASILTDTHSFY